MTDRTPETTPETIDREAEIARLIEHNGGTYEEAAAYWDANRIGVAVAQKTPSATFMGEAPDRGRIVAGRLYPGEGYAVIRCGGTEVVVGYTLLHQTMLRIDKDASAWSRLCELQRALHAIACEASLGRNGDDGRG